MLRLCFFYVFHFLPTFRKIWRMCSKRSYLAFQQLQFLLWKILIRAMRISSLKKPRLITILSTLNKASNGGLARQCKHFLSNTLWKRRSGKEMVHAQIKHQKLKSETGAPPDTRSIRKKAELENVSLRANAKFSYICDSECYKVLQCAFKIHCNVLLHMVQDISTRFVFEVICMSAEVNLVLKDPIQRPWQKKHSEIWLQRNHSNA